VGSSPAERIRPLPAIRRAEIGHHHHVAGPYLLRYAQESAWREDARRVANGEQVRRVHTACAITEAVSRFSGYYQRHGGIPRQGTGNNIGKQIVDPEVGGSTPPDCTTSIMPNRTLQIPTRNRRTAPQFCAPGVLRRHRRDCDEGRFGVFRRRSLPPESEPTLRPLSEGWSLCLAGSGIRTACSSRKIIR
jgi:hypothetical protein